MNELLEKELKTISIEELNELINILDKTKKKMFSAKLQYEKNILLDSKITSVASLKRYITNLSKKSKSEIKTCFNEFMFYYDTVHNIFKNRLNDIYNCEDEENLTELNKTNETYFQIIKLLGNDEDYLNRLGFDTPLYNIKTSTNVEVINNEIISIITSLNKKGIILNSSDFKYIYYVNNYINEVFKTIDNGEIKELNKFLKQEMAIYKNMQQYIYLTVLNLLHRLKPHLIKYLNKTITNKLINVHSDETDIYNKYFSTRKKYINKCESNVLSIIEYFKDNKHKIDLYNKNNSKINKIISSISNIKIYNKYTLEERVFYTNNLIELYWDLDEYKFVNDYSHLFDYVKNILNEPYNPILYRNNLKSLDVISKRIRKLNNKLQKAIIKLNKVLVMDSEVFERKQKDIESINHELDELVNLNMELLSEHHNLKAIKNVHETINESSTIHDVLKVLNNNYDVMISIDKDISKIIDMEFFHHLSLLNNIYYTHIDSIKYLIEQKYNLYNININIPDPNSTDFEKLKNDLEILIRYLNIVNKNLSVNDIKIILNNYSKREE